MEATSYLARLCVIPGWALVVEQREEAPLFLVPGLSTCSPALSHPQAALTGAKGGVPLPPATAGHN